VPQIFQAAYRVCFDRSFRKEAIMANTRKSEKRARQAAGRQTRNTIVRSATRSALRAALDAIKNKDAAKAKEAYLGAVKALSKAASKGAIPAGRASRKVSRLTQLAKKALPSILPSSK
jgi:small subunit ribosomal protein S20